MSPASVLAWVVFAYLLLRAIRHLSGARLYLTCALREVEARPVDRHQLEPGELRLLGLLDDEVLAAGFRPLGCGSVSPSLTYFGAPLMASVFVNERIPAYAFVHRHMAPEHGRLVELEVRTALASGDQIVTVNTPFWGAFVPPGMHIEALIGLSVGAIVERHAARVEAARATSRIAEHSSFLRPDEQIEYTRTNLQAGLDLVATGMAKARMLFRERKWVVPTANPRLDRFTLRGALALTRSARRPVATPLASAEGALRGAAVSTPPSAPGLGGEVSLRVEADLQAILHVAEHPEPAPGTPWPLLAVIATTALLSFVAMAALWNVYVAALILAVITFHEAGHASAMRVFGYRDVHVFFVPLLGAMTVGRPAVAKVRDRLVVLLAGPVPGLWLAAVLLVIESVLGPAPMLHRAALALLILNALNLLPFTPLDGGRVLEALIRPESVWRPIVHGLSVVGLLVLAALLHDSIVALVGAFWIVILPQSWASYRLRRAIAAAVEDRGDFRGVARSALEVMTAPRYAKLRAATRQVTARSIARLFSESLATPADRRWGAVVYAAAWIPVAAAIMLWMK
jgi:Zn-dependent protease